MQIFKLDTTDYSCGVPLNATVKPFNTFVGLDIEAGSSSFLRNLKPDDAIALGEALAKAGRAVQRNATKTLVVEVPAATADRIRHRANTLGGRVVSES